MLNNFTLRQTCLECKVEPSSSVGKVCPTFLKKNVGIMISLETAHNSSIQLCLTILYKETNNFQDYSIDMFQLVPTPPQATSPYIKTVYNFQHSTII